MTQCICVIKTTSKRSWSTLVITGECHPNVLEFPRHFKTIPMLTSPKPRVKVHSSRCVIFRPRWRPPFSRFNGGENKQHLRASPRGFRRVLFARAADNVRRRQNTQEVTSNAGGPGESLLWRISRLGINPLFKAARCLGSGSPQTCSG